MAKRKRAPDDFDSPWKDALHHYLAAFLAFFFPDIHADIDWSRGYEPLDKEFQRISRRAKVGKRLADKLFKVWLKSGEERWLYIHIEIQGGYEEDFPRRMFEYNSAARLLYNKTVVSLAVLCDDREEWRPASFRDGQWGCDMTLTFRIAKLLEYRAKVSELEASANPFAAVALAHLKALETQGDPLTRLQWKVRMIKGLFQASWPKEEIGRLFRLIDWVMALPAELDEKFRSEFEEEKQMEYMTSIERLGFRKGREEGLHEGLQKGRQKGRQEGREKGREEGLQKGRQEGREEGEWKGFLEGIGVALEAKFGAPGRRLLPKVRALKDVVELRSIAEIIKSAQSVDEVRSKLPRRES